MAIEINGKVYRNLQEQVYENSKDIIDLKDLMGYHGPFASLEAIENPKDKVLYLVGESIPYEVYQYNALIQQFEDLGPFAAEGPQGETGPAGPQGETGPAGPIGPQGPQGIQGETGPQGMQGPQGSQGPAGQDGLTTSISVNGNTYTQVEGVITLPDYSSGDKLDAVNPTGSGYFSLNRKENTTIGEYSFAEGYKNTADGARSHAEGNQTVATGLGAHAEGLRTYAYGYYSHAEGRNTSATHSAQHVFGAFNEDDPSIAEASERGTYIEIVGNGTASDERSNARTLDWNGNETIAGNLTAKGGSISNGIITKAIADLSTFSGSYTDLTDKPSIPTDTSDLTNGAGFVTSATLSDYDKFISKSGSSFTFTADEVTQLIADGTLLYIDGICYTKSFYAASPFYLFYSLCSVNATSKLVERKQISINQNGTWSEVNDTITLATVATSGDYNDLSNTPTIPTNYVTIDTTQTITGTKTFTGSKKIKLRQYTSSDKPGFTIYSGSGDEKAYLEYNPASDGAYIGRYGTYRVDQLGFMTSTPNASHKLLVPNVTLSGDVTDYIPISINNVKADSLGNVTIDIPTATSDLTNDSGFITTSALSGYATETWVGNQGYLTSVAWNDVTSKPTFATVATSGSYNDLSNKPNLLNYVDLASQQAITGIKYIGENYGTGNHLEIPYNNNGHNSGSYKNYIKFDNSTGGHTELYADSFYFTIKRQWDDTHYYDLKLPAGHELIFTTDHEFYLPISVNGQQASTNGNINLSYSYNDLTNKPDLTIYAQSANLAAVATSGSYNDLTNKPTFSAAVIRTWEDN